MEITELLMNFRDITSKAIEILKEEKYEELDALLNEREEIINNLKSINMNSEHFKVVCNKFDIMKLEGELNDLLKNKRDEIRIKLELVSKNIQVNNSYNKIIDSPLIFSKKI